MSRNQALQTFSQDLSISHSQIFSYLTCSLNYHFKYVKQQPPERISINLPFGRAIHSAMETAYRSIKNTGLVEPVNTIVEVFEECLNLDLDATTVPIVYKKASPDRSGALALGKAMLEVFHENIVRTVQTAQIVEVELPLSAKLYTDEGQPTEFKLVGILDLLLMDDAGEIIIVDNKTAAQPMSQTAADDDHQMTCYSYLIAANSFIFPTAKVKCRFDVLRKLKKKPKLEQVETFRTAQHRKRFARIANAVLAGIDTGIFMPQPSWMCSDCAYSDACKSW
ncbi:MAG: PD-(D/E)XK nuclease family protein [Deltaproteobacteria bacterium]|nr:PD-(D/E)XK nuclease family protein [Deltaproteobacteria bacterium]